MSGTVCVRQRDMCGWVSGRLESGGVANDFAPVAPEALEEFVLGELLVLGDDLGEIGEGSSSFGLDVALCSGGEESAESGSEVAIGKDIGAEEMGDVAADFTSFETFAVLLAMVVAKPMSSGNWGMVQRRPSAKVKWQRSESVGIGISEDKGGKRKSPREEARAQTSTGRVWRTCHDLLSVNSVTTSASVASASGFCASGGRRGYAFGVVAKARVISVFCSSSWALAEPVAGLALAERFTVRTFRFFACAMRSRRGRT